MFGDILLKILILCILVFARCSRAATDGGTKIPENFLMGVATSAYQIEGGWDADGKGPSIWDEFSHNTDKMKDNGDIACDSYHKWERDVEMIKYLGVTHYRFSLSWSRILPNGENTQINQAGIDYYKKLIKALIENGITPMVTLYHWDLPQALQAKVGGWVSDEMVTYFTNYAKIAFEQFGDDVKYWFTFNEPKQTCNYGYGSGLMAPGHISEGLDEYVCAYVVLKAHASAYHLYDEQFRSSQKGKVSYVFDATWYDPVTDTQADKDAVESYYEFQSGLYANAIYHPNGNFPKIVIDRVAARSQQAGLAKSRLPVFTQAEITNIKGTYDFLSFNTYTSLLVRAKDYSNEQISLAADSGAEYTTDPSWERQEATRWPVLPESVRKQLNYIYNKYNKPEIIITENGYSDLTGKLADEPRQKYFKEYLRNILLAKEDGVNIFGYTAWSLMDNLEWNYGFAYRFGLYNVDFNDPDRKRTIKQSGEYYKRIIETRDLDSGANSLLSVKTTFLIICGIFLQQYFYN